MVMSKEIIHHRPRRQLLAPYLLLAALMASSQAARLYGQRGRKYRRQYDMRPRFCTIAVSEKRNDIATTPAAGPQPICNEPIQ